MDRGTAKNLLECWSQGAYVGRDLLIEAVGAFEATDPFIEGCMRRRESLGAKP